MFFIANNTIRKFPTHNHFSHWISQTNFIIKRCPSFSSTKRKRLFFSKDISFHFLQINIFVMIEKWNEKNCKNCSKPLLNWKKYTENEIYHVSMKKTTTKRTSIERNILIWDLLDIFFRMNYIILSKNSCKENECHSIWNLG